MNPGDDGGSDPSSRILRRRRSKKQQPNKIAARPKRPRGTPIPIPIFCCVVRPELLGGGAGGSVGSPELAVGLAPTVSDGVVEEIRGDGTEYRLTVASLADAVEIYAVDLLVDKIFGGDGAVLVV